MRLVRLAVLALGLSLVSVALAAPAENARPLQAGKKSGGLKVTIDRKKVDLENRRLEVKMSRPAGSVKIKVLDADGAEIAEEEHSFEGKPANTPLIVTWTPKSKQPVARIEVYGYDADGNWAGIAIVPWSLSIPHQEVLFDTDKAIIKKSEEPKLEESFERIEKALNDHKDLGAIKLFIAGHTDTVGTPAYNAALSRRRAQAIAGWFRKRGLKLPIFFEGFGESAPVVKTGDEVDEPKNRRVDYILAIDPPSLKSGAAAAWKRL